MWFGKRGGDRSPTGCVHDALEGSIALVTPACRNSGQIPSPGHLRGLLKQARVSSSVQLVNVPDTAAAERERFLGSPTLRIDGRDVERTSGRTDWVAAAR
jgi:hypothetical protein